MTGQHRSPLLDHLAVPDANWSQPRITDALRKVIVEGLVPPGTPVPLAAVAQRFGVSHIPVREALQTLTSERLLSHRHNAGYHVAELSDDELEEMYLARLSLEAVALRATARQISEAEIAEAAEINARMAQAIRADDVPSYHRESRNFHTALARASGMLRVMHLVELAWNVTEPPQPMVRVRTEDRYVLHADHEDMLEACRQRDVDRLLEVFAVHSDRLTHLVRTGPGA